MCVTFRETHGLTSKEGRKSMHAAHLKAGITKNEAKQLTAWAFPNAQSLKGSVCHFDGAGASDGGLWVPPLPACAPHSLSGSLFPDDGLKSHFYYYYFFKTQVLAFNSFRANGFLSTPIPHLLNSSHTFSIEVLPLQSEGRTECFGASQPAVNLRHWGNRHRER